MQKVLTLHQTTIGKKAIMAVTGVIGFGFLIGHLVGNLQIYIALTDSPEAAATALHEYAAGLRRLGPLLWIMRITLVAAVAAHIWAAIALVNKNAEARPTPYQHPRQDQVTTYAARTMQWSGPILALFLLYHLLHLTWGYGPGFDHQNVYNNLVYGFQKWWIAAVYVVANIMLGFHLYHGGWSWLQSLGASHPRYDEYRKMFAVGLAAFLTLGNVSIPAVVLAGVIAPVDASTFEETHCAPELASEPGECDYLTR
jgi:succinate dehydrogenase / fumarate reductase cytochrome b subunit